MRWWNAHVALPIGVVCLILAVLGPQFDKTPAQIGGVLVWGLFNVGVWATSRED